MCHHELESSQILEDFSHNNCGDINNVIFYVVCTHNSVNQSFPDDQCIML